jgi:alpha-L-fucosidase
MKYAVCLILCMLFLPQGRAQFSGGGEANPGLTTHPTALKKFRDMRFGMFIHWGPVSLRGEEISWSRGKQIPIEEYDQLYREFNPDQFDASAWVATAKAAGMQYLVITSRHHDGFSLWDSKYTDYDMAATPYGRGVIKELSEACREADIVFGTYYSICDWYRADYPVEYPAADYSFNEERTMDEATKQEMDHYITFMKNQLEELITEYNSSMIWFDGEWEWAWTHQMGMDMYTYLRDLKKDLLINNRVDKGRNGMVDKVRNPAFAGDYATPEQNIGTFDRDFAWETCMTIGSQWAWKPDEKLKSSKECIHTLIQTIGGDGNLLFNVGPKPNGQIEKRQVERLKEMGSWVSINQEAIYGTRGGPWMPTKKLASTHKENKIYLYLLEEPEKKLSLPLDEGIKVQKVYFLQNGQTLEFEQKGDKLFLMPPPAMPDPFASTLVLELDRDASEIEPIEL